MILPKPVLTLLHKIQYFQSYSDPILILHQVFSFQTDNKKTNSAISLLIFVGLQTKASSTQSVPAT